MTTKPASRSTTSTATRSRDLAAPVARKAGWSDLDVRAVDTARLLAADAVQKVGNGHPGTAMSLAPVAYLLSAFAAVVYIVLTVALATGARKVALAACLIELAGVLIIGTLSLTQPEAFPRATVWSGYGSGYGFVPLVLPVIGLYWLFKKRSSG